MRDWRGTVAVAVAALIMGCAPRSAPAVRTLGAELVDGPSISALDAEVSAAASALVYADEAVTLSPENAWGYYHRAVALHRLHRTAPAVEAYLDAQGRFGDSRWGTSIAIYGRARVLDEAGRCNEARHAYEEFATYVERSDPASAAMARHYARLCRGEPANVDDATESVAVAVVARDYARALALAERASAPAAARPWLDYNRGVALAKLERTGEAVEAFQAAEREFAARPMTDALAAWGRSVAIYGRARTLDDAGRCEDARKAYAEYATALRNPDAAAAARGIAARCDVSSR